MTLLCLDTNILNEAIDNQINPFSLKDYFYCLGYELVIPMYLITEAEQSLLSNGGIGRLMLICQYIKKLDPKFTLTRKMYYEMEFLKLKGVKNKNNNPLASGETLTNLSIKIDKLSNGLIDKSYIKTLEDKKNSLNIQRKKVFLPVKSENKSKVSVTNYKKNLKLDDFIQIANFIYLLLLNNKELNEFSKLTLNDQNSFFSNITNDSRKLSIDEVKTILNNPDHYPAINAALNANIYLCIQADHHQVTPSVDRFTDFLIFVESSYCHALLSYDNSFITRHAEAINRNLKLMNWKDHRQNFLVNV